MAGGDDQCPTPLKLISVGLVLSTGFGLGLHLPAAGSTIAQYASSILGWTYFAVWSISFYPQMYLNWRRRSVAGLSFDFELLNLLGFTAYAIFNWELFFNETVRAEYAQRHDGHKSLVQANDVVFAAHGAIITALTIFQCFVYEGDGQRVSYPVLGASITVILFSITSFIAIKLNLLPTSTSFTELDWLYWLSMVKLGVSIAKYIPQVMLNHRRRSTVGWNIYNVLCDFSGGILSISQLFVDVSIDHSWKGVVGDPVKLALGLLSLFFDVIFMAQHYCLYNRQPEDRKSVV